MNFETWDVDLAAAAAIHSCGFKLTVEGDLSNPTSVHPGTFPEGLTPVEQARLLRCGLEAIMKASQKKLQKKSNEAFLQKLAQNKPARPILSLKK